MGSIRILQGVERYRLETKPHYAELFLRLAEGQAPHTMFITCCDSRINPALITGSEPGELFVLRNIGNIVPPALADQIPSEGAALEYAVGVLQVSDVIVCGHSSCGAISALLSGRVPSEMHSLTHWLEQVKAHCTAAHDGRDHEDQAECDAVARENVVHQLENLLTYPLVRQRVDRGELDLHGWFFDIAHGELDGWIERERRFARLDTPSGPPRSYGRGPVGAGP